MIKRLSWNLPGEGQTEAESNRKTSAEKCCCRRKVSKNTKNEPVVGRNIFRGAWPCIGAELTPGLWICQTKEVRTWDPVRHGRLTAIEGWGYTRPCKAKNATFYFVYPKPLCLAPDAEKYPWLWLVRLRYVTEKSLKNKEKRLDYIGRAGYLLMQVNQQTLNNLIVTRF